MTSQNIGVCFFSKDCAMIRRRLYRPATLVGMFCLAKSGRISMNPYNAAPVIDSAMTLFVLPQHSRQNRPRTVPANLCSRILSDPTAWHACLVGASRAVIVATTIPACLGRGHLVTTAGPHSRPEMKSNRMSRMWGTQNMAMLALAIQYFVGGSCRVP